MRIHEALVLKRASISTLKDVYVDLFEGFTVTVLSTSSIVFAVNDEVNASSFQV